MDQGSADRQPAGTAVASVLVCGQDSRPWRRQVGALAWAALEEVALTAHRDQQGWASPAGVHAIATAIGTTDAAALGALAALVRAGLATLEPVTDPEGHRGCGFRLHLPPGIEVRASDQGRRGHPRGARWPQPATGWTDRSAPVLSMQC